MIFDRPSRRKALAAANGERSSLLGEWGAALLLLVVVGTLVIRGW